MLGSNIIKRTYFCKDVNSNNIDTSFHKYYSVNIGDVAVFKILKIGNINNVLDDKNEWTPISLDDYLMCVFGTCAVSEIVEGRLLFSLDVDLHLVDPSGVASVISNENFESSKLNFTVLRFVGFIKDPLNRTVNTKESKRKLMANFIGIAPLATKVVLSIGISGSSGKETTSKYLMDGMKKAGYKIAFLSLTGIGNLAENTLRNKFIADISLNFSDFGFPSTYNCNEQELLNLYESALLKMLKIHPDFVIIELAGGLTDRETKLLLNSKRFMDTIETVVFSASDSQYAIKGNSILNSWGIHPFALSGLFTTNPLMVNEVEENTLTPVYKLDTLAEEETSIAILNNHKLLVSNK